MTDVMVKPAPTEAPTAMAKPLAPVCVAALVFGVLACILPFIPAIGGFSAICSILGIVLGWAGTVETRDGTKSGKPFAVAGMLLGVLPIVGALVVQLFSELPLFRAIGWEAIVRDALHAAFDIDACFYAIAAIGLNIHFGYTGLLNFGQAGFLLIGGYGFAITVSQLALGLPFPLGIVMAIVAPIILALLLGIPTLRLRADYLAICTIAAAEIIRLVGRATTFRAYTGGSGGLTDFNDRFQALNPLPEGNLGFGPWVFRNEESWVLLIGWLLVIALSFLTFRLMHSPWGRVLKSIREDEDAARSLGKNVYGYKMQALVIGGVIGGIAGLIEILGKNAVQPDFGSTAVTFFIYTILILGGPARVLGPVVGSIVFWSLLSLSEGALRGAVQTAFIPSTVLEGAQVGISRQMLVGLALMLLMIFRPQGILGDRKELALDGR